MPFLIKLKTRCEDQEVQLRGNENGSVDFVKEVEMNGKPTLVPYKYYTSIVTAIDAVFRMRVNNREASTLEELLKNVKDEREFLKNEMRGVSW